MARVGLVVPESRQIAQSERFVSQVALQGLGEAHEDVCDRDWTNTSAGTKAAHLTARLRLSLVSWPHRLEQMHRWPAVVLRDSLVALRRRQDGGLVTRPLPSGPTYGFASRASSTISSAFSMSVSLGVGFATSVVRAGV